MAKEVIFISSVQKEFAEERQGLAAYIREDELLEIVFGEFRKLNGSSLHNPILVKAY